jgi:hypothetical protein
MLMTTVWAVVALLAACTPGGAPLPEATATPLPTIAVTTTAAAGSIAACADGQLRARDLTLVDQQWRLGLGEQDVIAKAWQPDAVLTGFRVLCRILEPGFRWQATYYSPSQQAYFITDTKTTRAAEFDPNDAPVFNPSLLNFGIVLRAITKAGYAEDTVLGTSTGIEVRVNAAVDPFGPSTAPVDAHLVHVAAMALGETRDLFISLPDGVVYQHTYP